MGKKRMFLICVIVLSFIIGIPLFFSAKNLVNAEENNIKKSISQFSGKLIDDLIIINEKNINNKKIFEISDGDYYYHTDEYGEIKDVVKANISNKQIKEKVTKTKAHDIAETILKKLTLKLDKYEVQIIERNFENNTGYTFYFKGKNNNNVNSGSFSYIDLFLDGQLQGAQVHIEDKKISEQPIKIEKEQARNIIFGYFNNHTLLNKYINDISNSEYTLCTNVFHGISVWELSIQIPQISNNYTFRYIIDANTGEFILKDEPKIEGFDRDIELEKKLQEILGF